MKETKKSKRKSIEKKEKNLQSKGITLIALVITKGILLLHEQWGYSQQ